MAAEVTVAVEVTVSVGNRDENSASRNTLVGNAVALNSIVTLNSPSSIAFGRNIAQSVRSEVPTWYCTHGTHYRHQHRTAPS